jgi:hypothetical protein
VPHITTSRSDHCPIVLKIHKEDTLSANQCIARYEVMWEREESLLDEIRKAWTEGGNVNSFFWGGGGT